MSNKYTNRNLIDFQYQASDEVNLAKQLKENAENAVTNYGPFSYARQGDYDKVMDSLLNRKNFTYDLNGDALYQQYKDNYVNQGKMAMMDTMGQAAAMTGGYGNSYAATVGNQAYQSSLQNLNNIVPELYQLAMDRYNLEGEQLNNKYNLLATDRANALEEHEMGYNKLITERDYASNEYNNAYTRDYTSQKDYADSNNTNYWNEYNANYKAEQDAKNYALQERQVRAAESAASAQAQIAALEEKYAGYISPELQKAANSTATKNFMGGLFTANELAKRNMTVNVGGETKRFDNRTQYVEAVMEDWYNRGKLTANEVAYLKGYYGIK